MKIVLAHPPLDDPTIPYHSTAYLAGQLVHCGFTDVAIRDVNIELVNWTFEPQVFTAFCEEAARRLRGFERQTSLTFPEQDEYLGLWRRRPIPFDELQRAVAGMRHRESFLQFPEYDRYRLAILGYFDLLGALSYPCELASFNQVSRGRFSPYSLRDLFDEALTARICQVFDRFLTERMETDAEFSAADCLGISIVYDHQIFHALHMARWAKRRWPEKQILLGGTAMSQLYKYIRDKQMMKAFFTVCDGIVVGEGETALCQLADAGGEVVPGMKVNNLISYDRAADRLYLPDHIHYENVAALGRPLFRYPWELYLSPERGINYSPTRGCYWNRCTFCDYGLNTAKPTSPWRERRVDQAVDDLRAAVAETGARFVYFAVDVMSPAYLDRLSDAILDAGLDIRWGAELRLEKIFSYERCVRLARSGCVSVSFGMESGSQRILDLIDKGTQVAFMGETMKSFSAAGIAVQLMAFSDFPTETRAEKEETRRFLHEHAPYWSVGGLGIFQLTGTAIVAKDPARFGIHLVEAEDVDIVRAVAYKIDKGSRDGEPKAMLTEDRDASFDSDGGIFPQRLGRPWAGGTDTLHSMIYYDVYGRSFFRDYAASKNDGMRPPSTDQLRSCTLVLPGVVKDSPFDIGKILAERRAMAAYLGQLVKIPREPTQSAFQEWATGRPPLVADLSRSSWIMSGIWGARLNPRVYKLFSTHPQPVVLGDLLAAVDEPFATKLLGYFQKLAEHGFVELTLPAGAAVSLPAGRLSSTGLGVVAVA
jgi:anaerobic magnesium-protoporphyrin IX monomethyl ester cyclase